jgi:uncharacterized protein (DUF2235 family)
MSKTIVFCADGTWNGPDKDDLAPDGHAPTNDSGCGPQLTNVCKLFAWLSGDLQPEGTSWGGLEMEKTMVEPGSGQTVQIAKYIHGVGDTTKLPGRIVGGAFGVGVTARIARGYTFISRNYVEGDRIVIAGFSRGAYTARALAGLIAGEGLLKPELVASDDDTRFDTAAAAWFRWRYGNDNLFQKILDFGAELVEWRAAFADARQLSADSFVNVKITAVAVWDTVGAMGIPAYRGAGVADLFRFCDTTLNENIALGVHAVALDEQRETFSPTLWDDDPRLTQALFPGGHCDVGGGYPEPGLSDTPLSWFVDRLQQSDVGLRFDLNPPCSVKQNPCDLRHCAWVENPAWVALGLADRVFRNGLIVNDTVRQRMTNCGDGRENVEHNGDGPIGPYAPGNLPKP